MKKLIFLIGLVTLLGWNASAGDSLHVWCSPDLYDLASAWVGEYTGTHPDAKAVVISVPADKIGGRISASGEIGFLTRKYMPAGSGNQAWMMVVGRDVIVPVINPENPYLAELSETGISREKFISALSREGPHNWGQLLGDEKVTRPLKTYWYNEGSMRACMTEFLQTDPVVTQAELVPGADALLNHIGNNRYALGFCRLADILDPAASQIDKRAMLIPVDVNGNNQVDYFESIYGDPKDLVRGVWIGKYPAEFCGNIYTIAGQRPSEAGALAFLEWVLGEGQQYLTPGGFTGLLASEKYNKVQSLYAVQSPLIEIPETSGRTVSVLIVLAFFLALGIVLFLALGFLRRRRPEGMPIAAEALAVFTESSMDVPGGLFFDRFHTWTFMEKDGLVRIGIDDFLQHITGRITKIKLMQKSNRIKRGEVILSLIQDGKQLDIYSPISGVIRESNEKLTGDSSLVNRAPYAEGWVYRVEPDNWLMDIRSYLMGEKYTGWLRKEFARLKDFMASTLEPDLQENQVILLQDGGELREHLLEYLGPKYWEKFQTGYLDASVYPEYGLTL